MATASDIAQWWERNRKFTAEYSDRTLGEYVQAHPGLFAVVVATAAQTAVEFPMALGAGFVDVLNLGTGAADGGLGYVQDGLRVLSVVGPMARGGQAILSRVLAAGGGGNCTWIAAAKALQITGSKPFAMVGDLAKAAGIRTSATSGAFIDELVGALRQLGAKVRMLRNPTTMNEVLQAASVNKNGAVVFSVNWTNPVFGPKAVGHSLVAIWDAALGSVRFADRYGKLVGSLAELERTYPGISGATPYGTMAFIENALIPQAAFLSSGVVASIYDALALEVTVVFSPSPEVAEQVRRRASVTTGDLIIQHAHIVARGDSLSKIALQYYKDMMLWPLIYDANRDIVGGNPNLIQPGQKLAIPDPSALNSQQLSDIRRRGGLSSRMSG